MHGNSLKGLFPLQLTESQERRSVFLLDLVEIHLNGHLTAKEHLHLDSQLAAYGIDVFHHTAEILQRTGKDPDMLAMQLSERVVDAKIPSMVVTLGSIGAVWADQQGRHGVCNALDVQVMDTTGAGDAFFAGVAVGLTYGKSLAASCDIGTRLAASVIRSTENTCPRFLPEEFGITLPSAQPSD